MGRITALKTLGLIHQVDYPFSINKNKEAVNKF